MCYTVEKAACTCISIPLWYDYKLMVAFASIKVSVFQFLYGTIIRITGSANIPLLDVFQFLYGTIIRREIIASIPISFISIPLWYDYKIVFGKFSPLYSY